MTDPIVIGFDVDERTVLRFQRKPPAGDAGLPVLVAFADENDWPHAGHVETRNIHIDPQTATCRWTTSIPNPDHLILLGMTAHVRLVLSPPHDAMLVPDSVLESKQGRIMLFIVNDQDVVEARNVTIGLYQDGMREITSGLKAGRMGRHRAGKPHLARGPCQG